MKRKPSVYIIAGPNGAGKTTFALTFLKGLSRKHTFINADEIAKALCPDDQDSVAFTAGKEMLTQIRARVRKRDDFAMESTLSGMVYLQLMHELKRKGYSIVLVYLWVRRVSLAYSRVSQRVKSGGHRVPREVIRRRYYKGLFNFWNHYRLLADTALIFDNSEAREPTLMAVEKEGILTVLDSEPFAAFEKMLP